MGFQHDDEDDEAEMLALDQIRSDSRASRLGKHLPEDQRAALTITIMPGGESPAEEDPLAALEEDEEELV